jgi:uncharacterized protein (DUF305 family)
MTMMTLSHTHTRAAALIAALVTAACSSTTQGAARSSASSAPQAAPQQGNTAAMAKAKADSARYPYTEADIHFMSGMISHHAQAIAMARWAPTHGASPSVLTLCNRIINAQQDEINLMQMWLRDRRLPVPQASPNGMKMMMNGMEHTMLMPGMLSEEQMKQLEQSKSGEFDRLFLTFMIQHHRGAVSMVKELFDTYGAGQDELVFKFASDVNIDQTTEITRMEKMLVAITLGINAQ